jgi:hypothetical protein
MIKTKGNTMKIKVYYAHDVGYVDSHDLDSLMREGRINGFVRDRKLVFVGTHPMRKASTTIYRLDRRRGDVERRG